MLSNFFQKIWNEAYSQNDQNILSLLAKDENASLLDVGCGDGAKTMKFAKKIGTKKVYGLDGVKERLHAAKKRGVVPIHANLEDKWPVKNRSYDIVVSNQVIEHLVDIDHFLSEIARVLKPSGYCVVSTENLSSWHNIFALILGHQDFSHHLINKSHVGNPLSPHYGEKTVTWSAKDNSGIDDTAFPHIKIFTYKSLRKVFKAYGLRFVEGKASGYYPLFGPFAKTASSIDPYHSHFIVQKFTPDS